MDPAAGVETRTPPRVTQRSLSESKRADNNRFGKRSDSEKGHRGEWSQAGIVAKVEQLTALVDVLETQLAAALATAANLPQKSGVALSLPTALQDAIAGGVELLPRHRLIKVQESTGGVEGI